jgi:hypothetical protein
LGLNPFSPSQKLVSIQARVFGWVAAYSFTNIEPAKMVTLDTILDETLRIMLRKQGLKLNSKINPHKAVGIDNYTSSFQKILSNEKKKIKKKVRKSKRFCFNTRITVKLLYG